MCSTCSLIKNVNIVQLCYPPPPASHTLPPVSNEIWNSNAALPFCSSANKHLREIDRTVVRIIPQSTNTRNHSSTTSIRPLCGSQARLLFCSLSHLKDYHRPAGHCVSPPVGLCPNRPKKCSTKNINLHHKTIVKSAFAPTQ